MVLPLIILCGVSVSFVSLMQTRFAVATEAIKFDLKKIDPIAGFKRIFTKNPEKSGKSTDITHCVFICRLYLYYSVYRRYLSVNYGTFL